MIWLSGVYLSCSSSLAYNSGKTGPKFAKQQSHSSTSIEYNFLPSSLNAGMRLFSLLYGENFFQLLLFFSLLFLPFLFLAT